MVARLEAGPLVLCHPVLPLRWVGVVFCMHWVALKSWVAARSESSSSCKTEGNDMYLTLAPDSAGPLARLLPSYRMGF